uniref:Endonuclease-reverse transcriptase n=1 Tax=Cacopsylla melanoneura TaxID=428564 RepID=A0A8D9EV97_9HEMI
MEDIKRMLGELKQNMDANNTSTNSKLDKIQESLSPLQAQVSSLTKKVEKLDKSDRRKNVMIQGLAKVGAGQESRVDLENRIINIFHHQLQITDFTKMELDFVRRLGPPKDVTASNSSIRPVIVGLTTERRKFEILRNSNKLKDSKIYIHQDLTDEAREMKRNLVKQMKEERSKGNWVVIRQNKLVPAENKRQNKRALSESPTSAATEVEVNTKRTLTQSHISDFLSQSPSNTEAPKNAV